MAYLGSAKLAAILLVRSTGLRPCAIGCRIGRTDARALSDAILPEHRRLDLSQLPKFVFR
jgi:acyl-coenzyme A synthetase/AMP-(fatty) acid ligase